MVDGSLVSLAEMKQAANGDTTGNGNVLVRPDALAALIEAAEALAELHDAPLFDDWYATAAWERREVEQARSRASAALAVFEADE